MHFKGIICDVLKLKKLSSKYNIYLIEDVAQAFGSTLKRTQQAHLVISPVLVLIL